MTQPPSTTTLAAPAPLLPFRQGAPLIPPVKRRVTINLTLRDARNLQYHLRESFALNAERELSIRKAQDKLASQLRNAPRSASGSTDI